MQCLFKLSKCLLYIIVKCDRLTFICDKKNTITQNRMWQTHLRICLLLFLRCFWIFFFFSLIYVSTQCPHQACSKI